MMYNINDYNIELNKLGKVIIYLRKSREDMIDGRYASDEETLSRHLGQLQEWSKRFLGYEIPEENIYKEVVSGEKISARPVFKEVLNLIEKDDSIDAILCINCSRLSRGDLVDCGNLINILEITNTLVLTPQKTYNLKNKYDKRFFKDELLRGNDYLEMVKELLSNGRHWSVSQGKYIASAAPFGYDKVTCKEMNVADGKGFTLRPNENAEYVKMIFQWYLDGIGTYHIASQLIDMNAPLVHEKEWNHCSVRRILTNPTYYGYLTYGKRPTKEKIIDGKVVQYRELDKNCPIYKGLHSPIISKEDFMVVQEKLKVNDPIPLRKSFQQKSSLSGLVKCAICGRAFVRMPKYNHITRKRRYQLNKDEFQAYLNEHKEKAGLTTADMMRLLDIPKFRAYEWFGNNHRKFYPSDYFVSRWDDIKKILNIKDGKYEDIVLEYEDVVKKESLVCSAHKCTNVSTNFEVVENMILDEIKKRYENFSYYLENYEEEYTKVIKANKKNSENIDKKIALIQKQLKNAKIAYEQEVDSLQEYIERKKELNEELELLIKKKDEIGKDDEEDKIITIKKSIPILKNVFENYYKLSVVERNELLKTIIESVMYLKTERYNDDSIKLDICWII